jgi:hypothetical protein
VSDRAVAVPADGARGAGVPADIDRYSGDPDAAGGVRLVTLGDGAGRGLRTLEFRTGGGLYFEVLVDRAMDIGIATFGDRNVGWRSATGFRHPWLHDGGDEDGLAWLRSFSGLLVTGGLDHTLSARTVAGARYGYPPRAQVKHGLHGRVANIPATLRGYGRDGSVLWAEGEVRQVAVFGENLLLCRRIEADLGGREIRVFDTVINAGFEPTPHRLLYHINLGWPLLDDGTRFEAAVLETPWRTDNCDGVSFERFTGPADGWEERVFAHRLQSEEDGRTRVRVMNDRLGLGFELDYDQESFGHLLEWLNLRSGSYAVALEPTTHGVDPTPDAPDEPSFVLAHNEQRRYASVFRFLGDPFGGTSAGSARSGP